MAGNWIAFLVGITSLVGIYSIYVLGLNFEFGYTGLPNLGAVAYFAIGAYTSVLLTMPCPDTTEMYILGFNLPMVVGVIGGGIVASFFAFLLGMPTLRLRGDYFVVVTFGFAEVLRYVLENEHWLSNGVIGFYGLPRPLRYLFSSHLYEYFFAFLIATVLIVAYLVLNRVCNSPFGRLLKAIRENETICSALGKDAYWTKMKAFIVGSFFAGIAGGLYARYTTVVVPDMFSATVTFTAWLSLMIGGRGNNKGVILGTFIYIFADQFAQFAQVSATFAVKLSSVRLIIIGALLVFILRYFPRGILREKKVIYR